MPSTIRIKVPDLGDLRADLDSVQLGLGREVARAIRLVAEPIVSETAHNAPFDPRHRGHPHDDLPHIAESIGMRVLSNGAAIVSSHPGAPVWEFGGTIHPRSPEQEIHIPERAMARRAGEDRLDDTERAAMDAVNALLERHNL